MSELQKCLDLITEQISKVKNEVAVLEGMYNEVSIYIKAGAENK